VTTVISGNTLYLNSGSGIKFASGTTVGVVRGNTIRENSLSGVYIANTGGATEISKTTIITNTIEDNGGYSILLESDDTYITSTMISGNSMSGNSGGGFTVVDPNSLGIQKTMYVSNEDLGKHRHSLSNFLKSFSNNSTFLLERWNY
jgi:nitrous oxidase accessory protein NosD